MDLLKAYAFGSTTLVLALTITGFRQARQKPHFEEIDVERINVVEKDGTLRLTISNRARMPDPVIGGKAYPLRGGTGAGSAGLIFFNDEGNENGGLTYQGARTDSGYQASAGLSLDQFNQDETLTLGYADRNGRRSAGITILDRPDVPIQAYAESAMVFRRLADTTERGRRTRRLEAAMVERGEMPATRVVAAKDEDKTAFVMLADAKGRPRLRLAVDSLGAARIEFLDAGGHVTHRIPEARK